MAKKNKERRKTTSCGALAWRDGPGGPEVLLIKQFAHKDSWGIPKGHLDAGESLEACALREVMEETGVAVVLEERLADVGVVSGSEDKTVVLFVARPVDDRAEPDHNDPDSEVADARWFPIGNLPKLLAYQQPIIDGFVSELQRTLGDPATCP